MLEISVVQDWDGLASVQDFWRRHQQHPNSDFGLYKIVCEVRPEVASPYVMVVKRDGTPLALVLARLEQMVVGPRLGYLRPLSLEARLIRVLYQGVLGDLSSDAASAVVEHLNRALGQGHADLVEFSPLRRDSALQVAFRPGVGSLRSQATPWARHWAMALPADEGAVFKSIRTKHRNWLKKKAVELETAYSGRISWQWVTDTIDVGLLAAAMERVAAKSYQRALGAGFRDDEEHRRRLEMSARDGRLRVMQLQVDGTTRAYWLGTRYGDRFHSWCTAYDPELRKYEVGNLMFHKMVDELIREHAAHLDFGLGDAAYKERYATESWEERTVNLYAPAVRGLALAGLSAGVTTLDRIGRKVLQSSSRLDRVKTAWRRRSAARLSRGVSGTATNSTASLDASKSCTRSGHGKQTPSVRISILGASLDVGNRGVLALGVSTFRLIKRCAPSATVVFHYSTKLGGVRCISTDGSADWVEIRNCRMSPRSRAGEHIIVIVALAILHRMGLRSPALNNAWLRSIVESDLIGDIRGGDSFSDIYGKRRFLEGCLPLLSVILLRKPFVLLPQTLGPFRSTLCRFVAKALLKRAAAVATRDRNVGSVIANRTIEFCPDVAFTLESQRPSTSAGFDESEIKHGVPVIGFNVSGLLSRSQPGTFGLHAEYRATAVLAIKSLLDASNGQLILIPHVFGSEDEEQATEEVYAELKSEYPGRLLILRARWSERELKWLIGRTDFFVGSRMHACIAALSQCVPAVALAYSDKFVGVFDSAGVGDAVIDLRKCGQTEVVSRIVAAFGARERYGVELRRRIPAVQRQVVKWFSDWTEIRLRQERDRADTLGLTRGNGNSHSNVIVSEGWTH